MKETTKKAHWMVKAINKLFILSVIYKNIIWCFNRQVLMEWWEKVWRRVQGWQRAWQRYEISYLFYELLILTLFDALIGKFFTSNGDTYEGDYKEGTLNGQGKK